MTRPRGKKCRTCKEAIVFMFSIEHGAHRPHNPNYTVHECVPAKPAAKERPQGNIGMDKRVKD